jgi:hypothetical protein
VKPPTIGAMWRNGPNTRRALTSASDTRRSGGNPWCVAHNPEVAGRPFRSVRGSTALGRADCRGRMSLIIEAIAESSVVSVFAFEPWQIIDVSRGFKN